MEFTLLYDGQLKTKGKPAHKQEIRRTFHAQLKNLWQQVPLCDLARIIGEKPQEGELSIIRKVGKFTFAPLISEKLKLTGELSIIFLRPEPPGSVITQGGDIDNRLKTLFDALRMPKVDNEIPNGDEPASDEHPFFCVFEDDNLITKVSVQTDRLLQPDLSENEVRLIIGVKTKILVVTDISVSIGS